MLNANTPLTEVARIAKALPPFPKVVLELLDCLRDQSSTLENVVRTARNDAVITANILGVANHIRRLHAQSDLTDPFVAASIIGMNRIRGVVVSVGLNRFFSDAPGSQFIFHHSLAVAIAAHELAMLVGVSRDEAYIAGILHDVGQLCFHVMDAKAFEAAYQQSSLDGRLIDHERSAFGLNHCEIGAKLAELWKLPEDVQSAIATHHDEATVTSPTQAVVCLAETLVRGLDLPPSKKNRITHVNRAAMQTLELEWDQPELLECFKRIRCRYHYALRNEHPAAHEHLD